MQFCPPRGDARISVRVGIASGSFDRSPQSRRIRPFRVVGIVKRVLPPCYWEKTSEGKKILRNQLSYEKALTAQSACGDGDFGPGEDEGNNQQQHHSRGSGFAGDDHGDDVPRPQHQQDDHWGRRSGGGGMNGGGGGMGAGGGIGSTWSRFTTALLQCPLSDSLFVVESFQEGEGDSSTLKVGSTVRLFQTLPSKYGELKAPFPPVKLLNSRRCLQFTVVTPAPTCSPSPGSSDEKNNESTVATGWCRNCVFFGGSDVCP